MKTDDQRAGSQLLGEAIAQLNRAEQAFEKLAETSQEAVGKLRERVAALESERRADSERLGELRDKVDGVPGTPGIDTRTYNLEMRYSEMLNVMHARGVMIDLSPHTTKVDWPMVFAIAGAVVAAALLLAWRLHAT